MSNHQVNKNEITGTDMNTIESASSSPDIVKESFSEWLSDGHAKMYSPEVYTSCIDKVSAYLIRRKISIDDLWQFTNYDLLKSIYDKAVNDKLFRAMDKKTYATFVQVGQAFLKFLKNKPSFTKTYNQSFESDPQASDRLTIKEAIIKILQSSQRGMTVGEIYNKITDNHLYSFGAQNPLNVLRTQIGIACEGSNYTYRASKDIFRSSVNAKGEKIYFLLSAIPINETVQPSFAVADELTKTVEVKNEPSNIGIITGTDFSAHTIITSSELDDIVDLDEGKRGIREILNAHFLTLYGYSNKGILWSAAQNSLSMFLNDNAINSADDLWHFLVRAFKNELVLSSPHIWKNSPEYPLTSKGLVINLARQHGGIVTREQIDVFFSQIKLQTIYNSFVLDKGQLLFCDNAKFILTETANPTSERCSLISKALDTLFSCENTPFIVLRDISSSWFSCLPELPNGLQWTPLLLQELLRICPDIGYRIISSNLKGQALDTVGAAIVPSKSEIETFADVVHRFCFEKYKLPFKLSAEELRLDLREAGMLDGNELIYNMHKALKDHRFAFSDESRTVMILER